MSRERKNIFGILTLSAILAVSKAYEIADKIDVYRISTQGGNQIVVTEHKEFHNTSNLHGIDLVEFNGLLIDPAKSGLFSGSNGHIHFVDLQGKLHLLAWSGHVSTIPGHSSYLNAHFDNTELVDLH